jgi:hypothetical protein
MPRTRSWQGQLHSLFGFGARGAGVSGMPEVYAYSPPPGTRGPRTWQGRRRAKAGCMLDSFVAQSRGFLMYGVRADMDLSALKGATLIQIGLGLYQIQFRFQNGRAESGKPPAELYPWIGVTGRWTVYDSAGIIVDQSMAADALPSERQPYRVHVLLGNDVTSWEVDPPTRLVLVFASGHRLELRDDIPQFESFEIHPGDYIV